MTAREVVAKIENAGWYKDRQSGAHAVYKHPNRPGRVIPNAPKGIPRGTLNDVLKKAGVKS